MQSRSMPGEHTRSPGVHSSQRLDTLEDRLDASRPDHLGLKLEHEFGAAVHGLAAAGTPYRISDMRQQMDLSGADLHVEDDQAPLLDEAARVLDEHSRPPVTVLRTHPDRIRRRAQKFLPSDSSWSRSAEAAVA